ncbi:MAG: hypothetical protein OEL66_09780 [Desulfobulbaceae bacterium]|nr:hypothetical protein [Desulfobulbaceae bacterium]
MENATITELRETQSALQKMDDTLALLMQNQAIKAWNNIVISENEEMIFFFGVRSNPKIHTQVGGKKMQGLIDAQIAFRLHPSRKSRDDIYQTISGIRRTINSIANTLAMSDNSPQTLAQTKKDFTELQDRTKYFQQAGKLLQLVYLNLKRFTLLDMVGYIRLKGDSGSPVEQDFLQNGIQLFNFLEEKSSDPGHQELLPISTCMEKAEALMHTFSQYQNTCEELAESTSHLVPAVINDRFIIPVGQVLQKIHGSLKNKEGMLDKLTAPVQDAFSRLNRSETAAFYEYFKEIEDIANRVKITLIDLGRNKDFLTIIDTSNAIITEATAFSSWLRNLDDDLEEEFRRKNSPLNMQRFADTIRKKYYTGGLISMVKRFFSTRLKNDLIVKILKTCPVLPAEGNKGNIKEMKDTTTLNNFLRKNLHQYEKTMVYKDMASTLRQGILAYAKVLTTQIGALPLNSSTMQDYYDCAALMQQITDPTRLGKKR